MSNPAESGIYTAAHQAWGFHPESDEARKDAVEAASEVTTREFIDEQAHKLYEKINGYEKSLGVNKESQRSFASVRAEIEEYIKAGFGFLHIQRYVSSFDPDILNKR